MAIITRTNSKVIKDPLFTPVIKYLKQRIADLEIDDPNDELELARQRYTGLIAGDLVIEDPISFPDGIVRVCIVSRKTGFARADVEVKRVTIKEILEDFAVPFVEINDVDELKAYAKANDDVEATLLWLTYKNTYGVLLNQENAKTMSGMQKAFGGLFFNTYTSTRESLTSIDYDTLESGTVKVTDPAFGMGEFPLFIYELVKAEAMLPEITSNLPTEITSSRGKDFNIPNTYWFGGVEDITMTAQVDITTDSGYTIPRRSDDKLSIEGETIFGATDKEVTDFIVVRVTHMYMGRPVKKTFRIKVIIEKDEQLDLTFVVTPAEITASKGDVVEVNVQAFFQGNPVTLNIPATEFESKKKYGNLAYVETLPDGSMTYRGAITGNLPVNWDKDTELYRADFQYSDSGTLYKAPAFVNMIVVKPEVKPSFRVTSIMTSLRGYKDEEGLMIIQAVYGLPDEEEPQVVSPKELGIKLGVKGDKRLIEFLEVTDEGVRFKLLRDSDIDGQSILDSFRQTLTWVDPRGVRYAPEYTINVEVKRRSVYEVVPGPTPLFVDRYQTGKTTFTFMLNGENQTELVKNLAVVGDNGYIYNEPKAPNTWRVLQASKTEDTPVKVEFEFFVVIDGVNTRFTFEQDFVVRKYTQGGGGEDGENTLVVAVPSSFSITGKTDEKGKLEFKVFEEGVDISELVGIVDANSSVPEQLKFNALKFNDATGNLELDYTKMKAGTGAGRYAFAKKEILVPAPEQRGVVLFSAVIEQARTFKVIEWPTNLAMNVEEEGQFKPVFEFAGVNVPLNDPILKITKTKVSDVEIISREEDHLRVIDNLWRFVGRTYNVGTELTIEYTDPLNPVNTFKQVLIMPALITFPPLRLEYDKQPIDAKIWDTGSFPIKLMAGTKDWTTGTRTVTVPGGNTYISVNRYNWSVTWAEKTAITTTVPLKITWEVGESKGEFMTDAVFNLAEWDQITFGIDYDPKAIDVKSSEGGEIVANFVYKGNDVTDKIELVLASSTIPETIKLLDNGMFVEGKGFVINYTTTRGGEYPMNLVFKRTEGSETISAPITTKVQWPDGLNVVTAPETFKGFYKDQIEYPLVLNVSGSPIELTNANLSVTFDAGDADPISVVEMRGESLLLSLDAGGDEDTDYTYPTTITLVWNDVGTGQPQTVVLDQVGTIRISRVEIQRNPVENVNVYDYGDIKIRLADERGLNVEIQEYVPRGTSPYIAFEEPQGWYVVQGSKTQPIEASLPLTLTYDNGGLRRTIDASVLFDIAKFDGIDYKGEVAPLKLDGKAGMAGDLQFEFTYKGKPYTESVLDDTNTVIPKNLAVLPYDPETGKVTYTLVGQAEDTAKFVFKMATAGATPVEGMDQLTLTVPVKSVSSDEVFTLGDHGDKTEMFWKGTDLLTLNLKYGEYDLPANAPGLKYTITGLNGAGDNYVSVGGKSSNGIYIKGERSNVPGGIETFNFVLDIEYEVGAPTPKTASFNFTAKITMGEVEVTNNDDYHAVNIWDKGSFWQGLKTPESAVAIDHFELVTPDNRYVELTPPRGYEIIGAEPTTGNQVIPMRAYYKVDAVAELQVIAFEATFRITGSTSVRFKVIATPSKIETGIDSDVTLSFRPVYKDQNVGSRATFKQDLSTIPAQVEVKQAIVNGILHEITFTGKKGGVAQTKVVFWSPDAGTNPKPRDVVELTLDTRVLGELTLEVGERDNLLTGTHKDTGTYKLELLFGLLPLDIQKEIAAGNLTITRETGASTMPNAFVLNPKTWHADSFDYELFGPVAPGQTVNVSDFLNVTYRFGGTNYTRRIEIPMSYTTPKPTALSGNTFGSSVTPKTMWSSQVVSPILTCADTTIVNTTYPLQRIDYTETGKGKYVWIDNTLTRQCTVEGSEVGGIANQVVPFRFYATYRNWEYTADIDTFWWVEPWDGRTFRVAFTAGNPATPNVDTDFTFTVSQRYRATIQTTNLIDETLTDWKGLMEVKSVTTNGTTTTYTCRALDPGKETIPITFRRAGGPTPGVADLDYAVVNFDLEIVTPPLVITGLTNPILAGNQDIRSSGNNRVVLSGKSIPLNDPDLTITPANEDIFRITARSATDMTYEITAPLDKPKEIFGTLLEFVYTNPATNRVHKGTAEQRVQIQDPDDYPRWQPRSGGFSIYDSLYKSVKIPNWIRANGVDISEQCQFLTLTPTPDQFGWMILNPDFPATSKNQLFIIGKAPGDTAGSYKDHVFTFKAPFRGGWVDGTAAIDTNWNWPGPIAQFTCTPNTFTQLTKKVGEEFEVPFGLALYGKPHLTGYLAVDETKTANLNEPLTKYFEVMGQRVDAGITYLKLKTKLSYNGVMNFVWYTELLPAEEGRDAVNRVKPAVTMTPELETVPNPGDPKLVFRRYNLPFKVMSGDVDITATDVTLISVAGPNGIIGDENTEAVAKLNVGTAGASAGSWGGVAWTAGPTWLLLKCDVADSEVELTFKVRTSARYGTKDLTVVQKVSTVAWDQIQFKIEVQTLQAFHQNVGGQAKPAVYDQDGNLIIAFPYSAADSYSGSVVLVGRALGANYVPNTLVATNAPISNASALVNQSKINSTSDGIYTWKSGGGNGTSVNAQLKANKVGEHLGKLGLEWNWNSANTSPINGYPLGTDKKNSAEIPVKYVAFDPKLTWKDDLPPAEVSGAYQASVKVPTNGLMFGPAIQVNMAGNTAGETFTVTSLNTALATISTGTNDKGLDFFTIKIAYNNTGSDIETVLPIRLSWSPVSGRTYTLEYDQKVLIKGTGGVDPVPEIVEITPQTTRMYKSGGAAGFKVSYQGQVITPTYTTGWMNDAVLESDGYLEYKKDPSALWTCVKADPTEKQLTAKYIFTFTDGVRSFPMEAEVPFTIEAWDGKDLVVTNFSGVGNRQIPYNQTGGMSLLLEYKGRSVSMNNLSTWDIPKAEFEQLNPGLQFATRGSNSPANWGVFSFKVISQFIGKVRYPVYYTGPDADPDPEKNKVIIEETSEMVGYEEKLYWFPDNIPPVQVEGKKDDIVDIPIPLSMGLNIERNSLPGAQSNQFGFSVLTNGTLVEVLKTAAPVTPTTARIKILADNRGEDQVIVVKMRLNLPYYNARLINATIEWDQEVLIKGTGAGDTTIPKNITNPTVDVWQIGAALFDIEHNGKAVSLNQYKSVTVKQNDYVRTNPDYNPANPRTVVWEVYNGTAAGVVTPVTFIAVFNDGFKDVTLEVTSQFTIRPYDGKEFAVELHTPNAFNGGMVTTVGAQGTFYVKGSYRTRAMVAADLGVKYGVWAKNITMPGHTLKLQGAGAGASPSFQPVYTTAGATDMMASEDGYFLFGLLSKENDPNAVENVDYVKVKLPCYVYYSDKYYPRTDVVQPTAVEGRYSPTNALKYPLAFSIRYGLTPVVLTHGGASWVKGPLITSNGANVTTTQISVWFESELTTDPKITKDALIGFGKVGGEDKFAWFTVAATQISNITFPEVEDVQEVTASLGDTGPLPFKVTLDGVDKTSTVTLTTISANDYIGLVDGKWQVLNAPAADTDVVVKMTVSVPSGASAVNLSTDVTFHLKAWDGNFIVTDVKSIDGKVWDKGTELPFKVKTAIGGNEIPAKWITGISVVSPNNRVEAGPLITKPWKIIAGDQTQAVTEEVTYTITVNSGKVTKSPTQKVLFNIGKYDGIELVLRVTGDGNNGNTMAVSSGGGNNATLRVAGIYKGEPVSSLTHVALGQGGSMSGPTVYAGTGPALIYQFTPNRNAHAASWIDVTAKVTGSTDPKQQAKIRVPISIYSSPAYIFIEGPNAVTGKLGDELTVNVIGYTSNTRLDYSEAKNGITFLPAGVIEYVPGSGKVDSFKVRFLADVDSAVHTVISTTVAAKTPPIYSGKFDLSVTQQPAATPEITDVQDVVAKIWDKGELPFKVMFKGNDITADCTLTGISANSYVRKGEGNTWEVYDAATAESTVMPEFTVTYGTGIDLVTLKQTVKFTVKGWNGKLLKPVAEDSVGVVGKTGQIHIGGSFGDGKLYPDTTVDIATIDGKGIITVTKVEKATDDGLLLTYTGDVVGTEDITVRVKAIVDSGNAIEGSDFADVTLNVRILPATLTPSDDFETDVIGDVYHPATVKQSVSA
ncbi:hypothetical protein OBP_207 [Pseudomonas phage OBP]|uniref:hypothetical protein n=1 Tax=Pseudomonas phage OBP TaxID=1124849 RepID=UPI000240D229|nr:hypothetical protein OBP_207 [Pseudomonas phage OBP]AEV89644.1 hypothetical protein OBP_207 [Pseudomonas phage OBP]